MHTHSIPSKRTTGTSDTLPRSLTVEVNQKNKKGLPGWYVWSSDS